MMSLCGSSYLNAWCSGWVAHMQAGCALRCRGDHRSCQLRGGCKERRASFGPQQVLGRYLLSQPVGARATTAPSPLVEALRGSLPGPNTCRLEDAQRTYKLV